MGVIQSFERKLQGAVAGTFARLFGGSVHPSEVAEALQREAANHLQHENGRTIAPNHYIVRMGRADANDVGPDRKRITAALSGLVSDYIAEQEWQTFGPVAVTLEESETLHTGQFRVRSLVDPDVGRPVPKSVPKPVPSRTWSKSSTPGPASAGDGRQTVGRRAPVPPPRAHRSAGVALMSQHPDEHQPSAAQPAAPAPGGSGADPQQQGWGQPAANWGAPPAGWGQAGPEQPAWGQAAPEQPAWGQSAPEQQGWGASPAAGSSPMPAAPGSGPAPTSGPGPAAGGYNPPSGQQAAQPDPGYGQGPGYGGGWGQPSGQQPAAYDPNQGYQAGYGQGAPQSGAQPAYGQQSYGQPQSGQQPAYGGPGGQPAWGGQPDANAQGGYGAPAPDYNAQAGYGAPAPDYGGQPGYGQQPPAQGYGGYQQPPHQAQPDYGQPQQYGYAAAPQSAPQPQYGGYAPAGPPPQQQQYGYPPQGGQAFAAGAAGAALGAQPDYQAPNYGQPAAPSDVQAVLSVDDGSHRTYQLQRGSNIIGRGQDASFRLPDTSVSRRHVDIYFDGQVAVMHDLGSTNGTSVNGSTVQTWQLADGDVIRVGHSTVVFNTHG